MIISCSCPCKTHSQFINEELYSPCVNHISQLLVRFPSVYLHVTRKQGVTSDSEGSNAMHTKIYSLQLANEFIIIYAQLTEGNRTEVDN
jgi:hypothetical protein